MQAGLLERDAHHLQGARVGARLGQLRRLHALLARQQGQGAGLHIVLVRLVHRPRHRRLQFALGRLARDAALLVALHQVPPANDVAVARQSQAAHLGPGPTGGLIDRLHLAHRHGQHGHAVFALGKALQHAERRRRKLGQRRGVAHHHRQRERGRVRQLAPRIVLQRGRQHQLVLPGRGERRGKAQALHAVRAGLQHRGQRLALVQQVHLARLVHRHGGGERQRHIADRQAAGIRPLALALQLGGEGLAHLEIKGTAGLVGHAAGHLHTRAIDQLHAAASRQAAPAFQGGIVALGGQVQGLHHRARLRGIQHPHGNALTHVLGPAMHVLLQALRGGRAIELQHKGLGFVHRLVGGRPGLAHQRAGNLKLIAGSARQCLARRQFEGFFQLHAAARAGRQGLVQLPDPFARIGPATGARHVAGRALHAHRGRGLGIAQAHRIGRHLHHHLLHFVDSALRRHLADLDRLCRPGNACDQPQRPPPPFAPTSLQHLMLPQNDKNCAQRSTKPVHGRAHAGTGWPLQASWRCAAR